MSERNFVKRRVLRDDVVEYIVESIFNEEYKPGDRLVETRISRELEVSQGAVREAIRDLTARGVLETEPYKGATVKNFSIDGLRDYYRIRLELEVLALKIYSERGVPAREDFEHLEIILNNMIQAANDGNIIVLRRSDLDFHRSLVMMSASPFLCNSWEALGNEYWAFMGIKYELKRFSAEDQAKNHFGILQAVKALDVEELSRKMKDHFYDVESFVTVNNY